MSSDPTPGAAAPEPSAAPLPPAAPAAVPVMAPPPPPRPTMTSAPVGWVIAAMLLFWPTGIPALLASHRAARAFGAADLEVAVRESATARRWGIISVIVGAVLIVMSVLASIAWFLVVAFAVHSGFRDGEWSRAPGYSHVQPFGGSDRPGMPDRQGSDG